MRPDEHDEDPFAEWRAALGPWKPRPVTRRVPPLPRGQRAAISIAIAVGHALVMWMLVDGSRLAPPDPARTVTTLVFLSPPTPVSARPPVPAAAVEPALEVARGRLVPAPRVEGPALPEAETPVATGTPSPAPGTMTAVEPTPRADEPLRLYEADGSLALPDDVVDRLAEVSSDDRAFDFQLPGLMASGRFMDRPPVLGYEGTRFDRYWIPEKDMLTAILEKAVEATTGTVEIPIPGTRGGKLVCSVSLLALGGGCGVANNNRGFVVQADDPATLSPEEGAQCRAWWDQIVAADNQATWRQTRELYEASCRKPLARPELPPE